MLTKQQSQEYTPENKSALEVQSCLPHHHYFSIDVYPEKGFSVSLPSALLVCHHPSICHQVYYQDLPSPLTGSTVTHVAHYSGSWHGLPELVVLVV